MNILRKACFALFVFIAVSVTFTSCDKDKDDEKKTVENGYLEGSVWTMIDGSITSSYEFTSDGDGVYVFKNTSASINNRTVFTYVYTHEERVGAIQLSKNRVAFSISEDYETMTAISTNGSTNVCTRQK
jgi:predicted aspartyl protease